MASQPLVKTVFSTGAKDDLAAIDTYKSKPGEKTVNSIQSLSNTSEFDVSSVIGNSSSKPELGTAIKVISGEKLEVDKDVLTQRLLATNSKTNSSFRTLGNDAKGNMFGSMNMNEKLEVDISGVKSKVDSANIQDLTGLGSFLADYTGDKNVCKIDDFDAVGGVVGGLVGESSDLGMSGVWTKLTSGIQEIPVLTRAAQKSLPKLLSNGDLDSIFEISSSPVGKSMGMLYPNLGQDLSKAYGTKMSRDSRNKVGIFNKYLATMDNAFKDWDKFSSNGDSAGINILRLLGSSAAFQDLIIDGVKFLLDDDPRKNYLLHGLYKETTVEAEVKRFFPRVVLISQSSPKSVKKTNTIDPRTLLKIVSVVGILASN
jgi:hypothetical protein